MKWTSSCQSSGKQPLSGLQLSMFISYEGNNCIFRYLNLVQKSVENVYSAYQVQKILQHVNFVDCEKIYIVFIE
jgi:hypothetical protein